MQYNHFSSHPIPQHQPNGETKMNMTLNQFFAQYGHLLPDYYKRMMKEVYNHMKQGGRIIVPNPVYDSIIYIIKK